jgi:hypothetical protein
LQNQLNQLKKHLVETLPFCISNLREKVPNIMRQSQIPAASFVGIKSKKVVIVVASNDLEAR